MMKVVIIGAGGHAQVVADILLRACDARALIQPVGYLDDNAATHGHVLLGLPVLGPLVELDRVLHDAVIVSIGDNRTRQRLHIRLQARGENFVIAQHPTAIIAPDVEIGAGTMICAGAIANTGSVIGVNTILNTGCTVDHHSRIGDHVHIAPGVHIGGEVVVGEGALVGLGSIVMPRCSVGPWSVVGAAACVTKSVPAGVTVVGIPAKPLQKG